MPRLFVPGTQLELAVLASVHEHNGLSKAFWALVFFSHGSLSYLRSVVRDSKFSQQSVRGRYHVTVVLFQRYCPVPLYRELKVTGRAMNFVNAVQHGYHLRLKGSPHPWYLAAAGALSLIGHRRKEHFLTSQVLFTNHATLLPSFSCPEFPDNSLAHW